MTILSRSTIRIYLGIYLWLSMDQSDPSKKDESVLRSKICVSEKTVNKSNRKCIWHAVRLPSFSRNWPQRLYHRSRQSCVCSAQLFAWFDAQILSQEQMHRFSFPIALVRKLLHIEKITWRHDTTQCQRILFD